MKQTLLILAGVAVLYTVFFVSFTEKATVTTPEVKPTGNYERPVKEGNCYRHRDTAGNTLLVCG